MRKHILGATAILAAFLAPSPALGAEITVSVGLHPSVPGAPPPVVRAAPQLPALIQKSPSVWELKLDGTKDIIAEVTLALENDPDGYAALPVTLRVPFHRSNRIDVSLYSVKEDDSTAAARELYATPIRNVDPVELFPLYQRAYAQATKRLNSLESGRRFYAFDAQVFFKLLEIVKELGLHSYLVVNPEISNAKAYLQRRIADPTTSAVVANNIQGGTEVVVALIKQVESIETEQLKAIWNYIKNQEQLGPSQRELACKWYQSFERLLSTMPIGRLDRLERDSQLATLNTNAVTQCATRSAEQVLAIQGTLSPAHKAEAQVRLSESVSTLSSVQSGPLSAALVVRKQTLGKILNFR